MQRTDFFISCKNSSASDTRVNRIASFLEIYTRPETSGKKEFFLMKKNSARNPVGIFFPLIDRCQEGMDQNIDFFARCNQVVKNGSRGFGTIASDRFEWQNFSKRQFFCACVREPLTLHAIFGNKGRIIQELATSFGGEEV